MKLNLTNLALKPSYKPIKVMVTKQNHSNQQHIRPGSQLLNHPKQFLGHLLFVIETAFINIFNKKKLKYMYVHIFICYVEKVNFMFFPIENSE